MDLLEHLNSLFDKFQSPEVQAFLADPENQDPEHIVLKKKSISQIPPIVLANQIKARDKAREKIPTYYRNPGVVYPPVANLAQSSSQLTAEFKTHLLKTIFPQQELIDLTGGFGIDSFFLASSFNVTHVEPNRGLQELARKNHELLGRTHIAYVTSTAQDYPVPDNHSPILYLDPSRRDAQQRKVFRLEDCSPDPLVLIKSWPKGIPVVLKLSPLFDLKLLQNQAPMFRSLRIITVHNEVREILALGKSDLEESIVVDFLPSGKSFHFTWNEELVASPQMGPPEKFLYEPWTGIIKAGAFKTFGQRFNLAKLHVSSHLYTSSTLIPELPARAFEVLGKVSDKSDCHHYFTSGQANVLVRNYPMTAESLKKKLAIKDGGDYYLIATTYANTRMLLAAKRVY